MSRKSRRRRHPSDGIRIPKKLVPLIVVLGGLLLIGLGALIVLNAGQPGGGTPKMVIDQDSYDYGDVTLGSTVTTTFTVRNEGTGPLRIYEAPVELKAGC